MPAKRKSRFDDTPEPATKEAKSSGKALSWKEKRAAKLAAQAKANASVASVPISTGATFSELSNPSGATSSVGPNVWMAATFDDLDGSAHGLTLSMWIEMSLRLG